MIPPPLRRPAALLLPLWLAGGAGHARAQEQVSAPWEVASGETVSPFALGEGEAVEPSAAPGVFVPSREAAPVRTARVQRPLSVGVAGAEAGWRPVLRMQGVLADPPLREALDSNLPLRFSFRVELWRKGTFDRLESAQEAGVALVRDPLGEGYVVENGRTERRVRTLAQAEAAIPAAWTSTLRPRGEGRYYYLVTLDVETLSLSDLEELRRWLRGEARPAVEGRAPVSRAVSRGVRRAVVRLLGLPTRHYEVRTPFFSPR